MATTKKREKADDVVQAAPAVEEDADDAPRVIEPGQDIAHRPHLKVKPIGSRRGGDDDAADTPTVKAGTLFAGRETSEESGTEGQGANAAADGSTGPRRVVLPMPGMTELRFPYATYRSAPADEDAEKVELAALTGTRREKEVSAGFLLGVALIILMLAGGVLIGRLQKRVGSLESRLRILEDADMRTAALPTSMP
ncbi:MAG: hypothetical protein ACYTFZ_08675 [Planctomycetota bacterium]|jgi:hypothetical protein